MITAQNKLDWDDYFLGLTLVISAKSKDPHTKVGAILTKDNRVLSFGYNGFPTNMIDENLETTRPEKYIWFQHAEMNALHLCETRPEGATLYINMQPCNNCLMSLHQAGIKKIIYSNNQQSKMMQDKKQQDIQQKFLKNCRKPIEIIEKTIDTKWIKEILNGHNTTDDQ